MYKIYNIVKEKTNIRGYWLDNNKLYKDNINILDVKSIKELNNIKQKLFVIKEQLAVFYIKFNKAYIEDNQSNITVLDECIQHKCKRLSKEHIKSLLKEFGGITVIKNKYEYIIQAWR